MEVENSSHIVLRLVDKLLVVSIAKHGENSSLNTKRGLNNVRNVSFIGLGIKVGKILS